MIPGTAYPKSACNARCLIIIVAGLIACGSDGGPIGPTPPATALRYSDISAGYYHTCGLATTGSAFCWGGNEFGTLGDGSRMRRPERTAVAGGHRFAALDAGAGHNCAVTVSGAAWCWGQNDEGQLGDGTFSVRDEPVAAAAGVTFVSISAGHAHTCGVDEDGAAWCWGDDSRGQLGGGSGGGKSANPVRVLHDEPFAEVVAGYYQSCGITTTARAYCWGANESGQLGDGADEDSAVPVAVAGNHAFTDLVAGDRFVCGLSDGETWCWGANRAGELGTTDAGSAEPVRAQDVPTAIRLAASMGTSTIPAADPFACSLRSDGQAVCWGGAVRPLREAAMSALDPRIRFERITAGAQHACGLGRDGYAYCGGANYAGQLGDGTTAARPSMQPVH